MSERKILNISMPANLYSAVSEMADSENKSKAELTREIIREYITKRERWAIIRQWGDETAERLNLNEESDLEGLIHQTRKVNS